METGQKGGAFSMNRATRPTTAYPIVEGLMFSPRRILPGMRGRTGMSVKRTLAATTLFATSMGLMQTIPNFAVAGIVIPLWCASVGAFWDGWRGALRGVILSVAYPMYCGFLLAIAFGIFWLYALLHNALTGGALLN